MKMRRQMKRVESPHLFSLPSSVIFVLRTLISLEYAFMPFIEELRLLLPPTNFVIRVSRGRQNSS